MAKKPAKISPGLRKMRERLFAQLPDDGLHTQSRAMAAYVGRLADAVEAMEKLAENPNPTETQARHQQRVADAGKKVQKRAAEAWDRLNELLRDGTDTLNEKMNERAKLRPNEYAQEIRTAFRSMDQKTRISELLKAVKAGDAPTVAALTDAPSVVTGIDATMQDRMRETFLENHAPDEHQAMTDLQSTLSTAMSAASSVKRAASDATDPQYIAKIQREAEAAEAAQSQFEQAVGDE